MSALALLESSDSRLFAFVTERERTHTCKKCRQPYATQDNGTIFRKLCSTCDTKRVEAIVQRVLSRHGRKAGLAKLRALAEPFPPPVTEALLAKSKQFIRERNRLSDRWPLCRKCKMPIHPNNHGLLWPRRCSGCDLDPALSLLQRVVDRWGAVAARAKLLALIYSK